MWRFDLKSKQMTTSVFFSHLHKEQWAKGYLSDVGRLLGEYLLITALDNPGFSNKKCLGVSLLPLNGMIVYYNLKPWGKAR